MIRIVQTTPDLADALAALQAAVFPTLPPSEWFSAADYRQHVARFPDGQFAALADDGRVVGATTTLRTNETLEGGTLPFYVDFIGGGGLANHHPRGAWLYGVDVSVHPDFRRQGIGRQLYAARAALVKRLNLCGERVAGLLPGYPAYRAQMSIAQYAAQVAAGTLRDATLTMQLAMGFRLVRLLPGYVHDARSDDTATLLVRENDEYYE